VLEDHVQIFRLLTCRKRWGASAENNKPMQTADGDSKQEVLCEWHNSFGVDWTEGQQFTQGSSFLATLGFVAESRWDSAPRSSVSITGVRPNNDDVRLDWVSKSPSLLISCSQRAT